MILTKEYQLISEEYLGKDSYNHNLYVRAYAKYSEQDFINNRTKVQYQSRAYFPNGTYIYDAQGNGSVSGTCASNKSGSCTRPTTGETIIATTEGWVPHNSDGTMSISVSATLNFPNWGWSKTASGGANLPTIPRNSSLYYASGKENEDYPTIIVDTSTKMNIKYTKNVESYFDKLDIIAETDGKTQLIKTISETDGLLEDYVFSFTEDEVKSILEFTKNTNLGTTNDGLLNIGYLKFQLSTYADSTMENLIGSISEISRVARIKVAESTPNLIAIIEDVNDITKELTDENALIRYASTIRITPSYSANKFADIKSVTINGVELGDYAYLDIVKSSATTYTIVVTDSRNLSTTLIFQSYDENGDNYFKLIDYVPLTIRVDNLDRNQPADNKMKLIYSGNYYDGNFSENISNSLEVNFRYKKSTGGNDYSEWISLSPIIENGIYSQTYVSDAILDYESVYDIQVQAIDKLNNLVIADLKLNKGIPIANWNDEKFNINGKLTVNNQDVATAENKQSTSRINTYSCDYINNNFNINYIDEEVVPTNEFLNGKRVYAYRTKINQALTKDTEYSFNLPFADEIEFAWVDLSNSHLDNSKASSDFNVWSLASGTNTYCFTAGIKNKSQLAIIADDSWGNQWTFTIMIKFIKKGE